MSCRNPINVPQPDHPTIRQRQQAFGYTVEELKMVITPMVVRGQEAISSMGTDTPLAVLSERPQLLVQVFQAAVCPGDESADRSDPRRTGHVPHDQHRAEAQPHG